MKTSRRYVSLVLFLVVSLVGGADAEARPPVAAVFLIEGTSSFMGNQSYAQPNDCRAYAGPGPCRIVKSIPGAHGEVRTALGAGKQAVAARLGRDARGALVTYGTKPRVLVPMGPAPRVTGKRLGSQRSYSGEYGAHLAEGLETALDLLGPVDADRKVVFIVGGGLVRNRDELKARFTGAGVALVFLDFHPSAEFAPYDVDASAKTVATLTAGADGSRVISVASPADLASALRAAVDGWHGATP